MFLLQDSEAPEAHHIYIFDLVSKIFHEFTSLGQSSEITSKGHDCQKSFGKILVNAQDIIF